MKRVFVALIGLLVSTIVLAAAPRPAFNANAGPSTTTVSSIARPNASATASPTPVTAFRVRFVGAFVGPAEGVAIGWDAFPGAASYSIQGHENWLIVRQGEGVCVPGGAPEQVGTVGTTVTGTTTTFLIPLPQVAPPPGSGLIWWPAETNVEVAALDHQGRAIATDALDNRNSFAPCPDFTVAPSPTAGRSPLQLPNTGYGPESY